MDERGSASAAFRSSLEREESTVSGPERKIPILHLVERDELLEKTRNERLFVAGGATLKRQEEGPGGGHWIELNQPNQDVFEIDSTTGLVMVADGFGGWDAGDLASSAACKAMEERVKFEFESLFILSEEQARAMKEYKPELSLASEFVKNDLKLDPSRFADRSDVEYALREGLVCANKKVNEVATEGGTTVSAVVIYETLEGKRHAVIANRGDSRVYLFRRGMLSQLTRDDSVVQELVDRKLLLDDEDVGAKLSSEALDYLGTALDSEEGEYIPGTTVRNIRNVVTMGLSKADKSVAKTSLQDIELHDEDLLIEVTDGVSDNLTRGTTGEIVAHNVKRDPRDIAAELVKEGKAVAHTKDPRAKEDDMTALVVRIEKNSMSLNELLEKKLKSWRKDTLDKMKDFLKLDTLFQELYAVRNQLEIAMKARPKNKKLAALRDHVYARLELHEGHVVALGKISSKAIKPANIREKTVKTAHG